MRTVLPALVSLLAACATHQVDPLDVPTMLDGTLLTREDIEHSGARDGWDALRLGVTHLMIQYTREGSEPRVTHRGVQSFLLSPQVLLVLDGTMMQNVTVLQTIPAREIDYIQILSGRAAVVKYGTTAGNGAVVVKTGPPPADP